MSCKMNSPTQLTSYPPHTGTNKLRKYQTFYENRPNGLDSLPNGSREEVEDGLR
ncbi:9340_t:CDS:2 [Paraglomus brasilianum]|uniref:9340_t:CDS:1 n=1 Tax=Paraglomus brasilianum TaxID=144538 RepID=A0A9N8ZPZ3_9GLOM|nr:9340_t:CDS:2 [Paraglomus brasilianum]